MKRFFYILIIFLCIQCSLTGGQIRGILFTDTAAEDIGASMVQNGIFLTLFLEEIAKYTKLPLTIVQLSGENLRAGGIKKVLDELETKEDDLVFLYYCGHGFRSPSKEDPWPYLYLSSDNSYVDFCRIKERIEKKNVRFSLAMADCCNNVLTWIQPKSLMIPMGKVEQRRKTANIHTLFQETPQRIVASSAIPGEIAWAYVGKGSVFTLAFLDIFHDEVKNHKEVSWEVIFERVREQVEELQTPQYEVTPFIRKANATD